MENEDIEKIKRNKNNIYNLDDLKEIFYGDESIELKYETVAVFLGMMVAVITLINNIMM